MEEKKSQAMTVKVIHKMQTETELNLTRYIYGRYFCCVQKIMDRNSEIMGIFSKNPQISPTKLNCGILHFEIFEEIEAINSKISFLNKTNIEMNLQFVLFLVILIFFDTGYWLEISLILDPSVM